MGPSAKKTTSLMMSGGSLQHGSRGGGGGAGGRSPGGGGPLGNAGQAPPLHPLGTPRPHGRRPPGLHRTCCGGHLCTFSAESPPPSLRLERTSSPFQTLPRLSFSAPSQPGAWPTSVPTAPGAHQPGSSPRAEVMSHSSIWLPGMWKILANVQRINAVASLLSHSPRAAARRASAVWHHRHKQEGG